MSNIDNLSIVILGMNYIHNEAPSCIIHRDLKSANGLLYEFKKLIFILIILVVISKSLTAKVTFTNGNFTKIVHRFVILDHLDFILIQHSFP